MPVEFRVWITRKDLKKEPDVYFVFGDNYQRRGMGGQAKEMRNEPNAIGVATKWRPGTETRDYFTDCAPCEQVVSRDLARVEQLLIAGKKVVFPLSGLGTGLSQLPHRAPHLDAKIKNFIEGLAKRFSAQTEARAL